MSEQIKLYVANCIVTIEPIEKMVTDDFGQWFAKERKIIFDDSLESVEKGKTIFHEILHAHFYYFGHQKLGDNEANMAAIESFYLTLFDPKNKKVLEMLRKLYTEKDANNG